MAGLVAAPLIQLAKVDAAAVTIANPSFEQVGTLSTEAQGWLPYQNGYQRVTGNARTGTGSIKVTNTNQSSMAGAYQRINLNQTEVKPVFVGGFVKGENVSAAPGSYFGATLYAEIYMTDGSVAYWNSVMNTGTFGYRWIGFNTGSGFTTATDLLKINKPISHILLVPMLGNASGTAYFDDIMVHEFAPTRGAVTIMFDDGNVTDFTEAKPVLDQYGMKASTAISTGLIGTTNYMTWTQVKGLQSAGWNINSHSINHVDLSTLSRAQLDTELIGSKNALAAQGITAKSIAYPFGGYNAEVIAATQAYYDSGRSFERGDNPMGVFPHNVKVRQVTNTTTVAEVNSWINEAKNNKTWNVIVFHKIGTSADDQYFTTLANFKAMIDVVAKSQVSLISYDQGISSFAVDRQGTIASAVPNTPAPTPNPTNPSTQSVASLTLVDTTTGKDIRSLSASDTINLAVTPHISIRANTSPAKVGSVAFFVNGTRTQVENVVPYSIAGNPTTNGYGAWKPTVGTYIVSATPYTSTNAQGTSGKELKVTLKVINEKPNTNPTIGSWSSSASVYSSGLNNPISINASLKNTTNVSNVIVDIEIFGSDGKRKFQKYYTAQNFTANVSKSYSTSWTPTVAGTYSIKVAVFSSDWSKLLLWSSPASVTVR